MARWTGWLSAVLIVFAAAVPILTRVRLSRRAAADSPALRGHVVVGVAMAALAFVHTLTVLPALGSPAAVAGGMLALVPGAVAFFIVVAHIGLGLQLRRKQLKDRAAKRRAHVATATTIFALVALHVATLMRAR